MEIAILDFIQTIFKSSLMDRFMVLFTTLGNEGIIYYILLVLLLLNKKTRKLGVILGISMLLNHILSNITLKPLFARTRPFDVNTGVEIIIKKPSSYSFPSGHTAQAFTTAFAFLFAKSKLTKLMFVFACIMAFTRLYLYVHYPTDILGGLLCGLISGYIGYKIVNYLYQSKKGAVTSK